MKIYRPIAIPATLGTVGYIEVTEDNQPPRRLKRYLKNTHTLGRDELHNWGNDLGGYPGEGVSEFAWSLLLDLGFSDEAAKGYFPDLRAYLILQPEGYDWKLNDAGLLKDLKSGTLLRNLRNIN